VVPLFLWNAFDLAAPTTTTTTRLLDFNRINIVKLFSPFMTVLLAAAGASPVGINREKGDSDRISIHTIGFKRRAQQWV